MQVLIIGATGLLGQALVQDWRSDEVIPASSKDADIRDARQVRDLFARCRPDWTVLAAAYTDVDGCEKNPNLAHQVNCLGAVNVARAASEHGSRLMLVSTDYVFDGSKSTPYEVNDAVSPINVYGRSKADAERGVQEVLPDYCILRTSWLFGANGRCFPNTILELAHSKKEIPVVANQRGCPTFHREAARAIRLLVRASAKGIVHARNVGDCTWFEFAQELTRAAGLTDVAIIPIRSEELGRPARRPKYSVLSNASLLQYGLSMRSWQEAIRDYLQEVLVIPAARQEAASPR